MHAPVNCFDLDATGTVTASRGVLGGVVLQAAGAAATAVLRTGGASGEVIARLATPANTSVDFLPPFALPFADLHVTLTGTGARVAVYA